MLLISVFLANVVNLLSTDGSQAKERTGFQKITDSDQHIAWFLQVRKLLLA